MKVAVAGATGYSGGELVALLHRHPDVELVATFGGTSRAPFEQLHPSLRGQSGPDAQPWSIDALPPVDVVCLATPNETSAELAPQLLARGVRVLDLSGAFRLDAEQHARWYDFPRPELEAVYSLPEITSTSAVRDARLVANPGCYATSVILALAPLRGYIGHSVIADCKSGVTGAGKRSELAYSFNELHDDFKTYSTTGHRHMPEIQRYANLSDEPIFVPHLLPVARGILSTIYVQLQSSTSPLRFAHRYAQLNDRHGGRGLVRARPDAMPSLKDVVGTPRCEIGYQMLGKDRLLIVSVLDNLLKGAASQAVQNLNLMLGLDELRGLT